LVIPDGAQRRSGIVFRINLYVITGLVPVISLWPGATLFLIRMAGTDPRIEPGGGHAREGVECKGRIIPVQNRFGRANA
jgi:hypothetical protein